MTLKSSERKKTVRNALVIMFNVNRHTLVIKNRNTPPCTQRTRDVVLVTVVDQHRRCSDRQTFAIKITKMMIINKMMKKQEISIMTEPIADMETTL